MALFQSDRFMKTPQNHMESPKEKTVNLESILKEFDEERRTLEYPGAIREVSGPVVRLGPRLPGTGTFGGSMEGLRGYFAFNATKVMSSS